MMGGGGVDCGTHECKPYARLMGGGGGVGRGRGGQQLEMGWTCGECLWVWTEGATWVRGGVWMQRRGVPLFFCRRALFALPYAPPVPGRGGGRAYRLLPPRRSPSRRRVAVGVR